MENEQTTSTSAQKVTTDLQLLNKVLDLVRWIDGYEIDASKVTLENCKKAISIFTK